MVCGSFWIVIRSKFFSLYFIKRTLIDAVAFGLFYVVRNILGERSDRIRRCSEYKLVCDSEETSWVTGVEIEHAPKMMADWLTNRTATSQPGVFEM